MQHVMEMLQGSSTTGRAFVFIFFLLTLSTVCQFHLLLLFCAFILGG